MHLTAEKKKELFKKYGSNEKDTGSTEAQIALFSQRISHLTSHLKNMKNDKGKDIEKYRAIIKALKLRR